MSKDDNNPRYVKPGTYSGYVSVPYRNRNLVPSTVEESATKDEWESRVALIAQEALGYSPPKDKTAPYKQGTNPNILASFYTRLLGLPSMIVSCEQTVSRMSTPIWSVGSRTFGKAVEYIPEMQADSRIKFIMACYKCRQTVEVEIIETRIKYSKNRSLYAFFKDILGREGCPVCRNYGEYESPAETNLDLAIVSYKIVS